MQADLLYQQHLILFLETLLVALHYLDHYLEDQAFAALGISLLVSLSPEIEVQKMLQTTLTSEEKTFSATSRLLVTLAFCASLECCQHFPC